MKNLQPQIELLRRFLRSLQPEKHRILTKTDCEPFWPQLFKSWIALSIGRVEGSVRLFNARAQDDEFYYTG